MIDLKQALAEMKKKDYRDNNGTFSIIFLTCHRAKKEGGALVHLPEACTDGLPPNCKGHEMRGVKCMETGKRYAVHNRLIFKLNDHEVFWV